MALFWFCLIVAADAFELARNCLSGRSGDGLCINLDFGTVVKRSGFDWQTIRRVFSGNIRLGGLELWDLPRLYAAICYFCFYGLFNYQAVQFILAAVGLSTVLTWSLYAKIWILLMQYSCGLFHPVPYACMSPPPGYLLQTFWIFVLFPSKVQNAKITNEIAETILMKNTSQFWIKCAFKKHALKSNYCHSTT